MNQEIGKYDQLSGDSSGFVANVAQNQEFRDSNQIVSNEWQNSYHHSWCPFYYQQSWRPLEGFPIDVSNVNENAWTQNMQSWLPFQSLDSTNSMWNGMNPINYSSNSAQKTQKSDENKIKNTPKDKMAVKERKIEKIYSCRLCNETDETSNVSAFGAHLVTHLGRKAPFICQICGKEFKFRSLCRNHMMAHMFVRNRIVHVYTEDLSKLFFETQNDSQI